MLSDRARPAQDTHGKHEHCPKKRKNAVDGDTCETKRQCNEPNYWKKYQREKCYWPAKYEQDTPEKKSHHGVTSIDIT